MGNQPVASNQTELQTKASETGGGQFGKRGESAEVIYSRSDEDVTAASRRRGRGRERGETICSLNIVADRRT